MKFQTLTSSIVFLFASLSLASTQYNLDPAHGHVGFTIPHMMIAKVAGRFDTFEGQFKFDEKTGHLTDLVAKVDIDSINTNEAKRDGHLKSADFFGVRDDKQNLIEKKRWMTFKADKTEVTIDKKSKISGKLTLNGVTKPVQLDVVYRGAAKDPWGNQKIGFEATGEINRKDFGLTWNKTLETGGLLVGEKVSIVIDGEATAVASAKK